MNKRFIKIFWGSMRQLINKSNVAAISVTFLVAYLLFVSANSGNSEKAVIMAPQTWMPVTGSVLAAAIFLCLQRFISFVQGAEEVTTNAIYDNIFMEQGIIKVFDQRGSTEIRKEYVNSIKKAKERIWAFGMTNRQFIDQHEDMIVKAMQRKELDVIIGYWDPEAKIEIGGFSNSLVNIQHDLEEPAFGDKDQVEKIRARQNKTRGKIIKAKNKIKGKIKIYNMTLPSSFSCMVADDDVYFFPYLAGPESSNDPMILCTAEKGVGRSIVNHYSAILGNKELVKEVLREDENRLNGS